MLKAQTNSNSQNRAGGAPGFDIAPSKFEFVSGFELRILDFRRAGGFSLTELLIVIAIIVLALALAVPALNLITGAKSTEQAQNITSIVLAQARNEAIGLQQYRGIFFYYDPTDERVKMAMVEQVDPPDADNAVDGVDVYLDLVRDRDVTPLPSGTSVQMLDDAKEDPNTKIAQNDRYIGFNTVSGLGTTYGINTVGKIKTPYGGVLLFDSRGQLVSRVYALQTHRKNPLTNNFEYTPMGVLLFGVDPTDTCPSNELDVIPVNPANTDRVIRSAMGFVIYDSEAFKNAAGAPEDDQIQLSGNTYNQSEKDEEAWLDDNGRSLLINRYNGSLIKGE
jgi:prepilin-type N-terminal cleavage/methylation domain-containing protein